MTVTAYLMSAPATNTAIPVLYVSDTSNAVVASSAAPGTELAKGDSVTTQIAHVNAKTTSPGTVSAKLNIGLSKDLGVTGTTLVGDYKVRVVASIGAGTGTAVSTAQDVTITVTKNPVTDTVATSATVVMGGLATADSITSTTDEAITLPKALLTTGTAPQAVFKVTLKNANASTTTGESYTAYIQSGPGTLIAAGNAIGTTITGVTNTKNGTGRLLQVKAGTGFGIYADGSSGTSVIQVLSAAGAVLATKSVTFYGAVATIVATAAKPVIGQRLESAVVSFRAYDSAGVEVKAGVTAYLVSAATGTISNSYTACGTTYSTTTYWTCSATGVAAGTTNLTVTTNSASTVTTGKTSNAVSVRVGGTTTQLSDVIVAFDKATYAPGELAKITITPVDAAGLVLADDTYTVFSVAGKADYAFGAGSDSFSSLLAAHNGGVDGKGTSAGVATLSEYMPLSEGTVTVSYTTAAGVGSTAGKIARTITAVVSSASGSAAIEAANAAQASADAATDAANAAAESADAATAAAQDAAQAVADLATQVADLIASLKAQLTALTALVVKIQKKVKA
jgi:hypothetical protein